MEGRNSFAQLLFPEVFRTRHILCFSGVSVSEYWGLSGVFGHFWSCWGSFLFDPGIRSFDSVTSYNAVLHVERQGVPRASAQREFSSMAFNTHVVARTKLALVALRS